MTPQYRSSPPNHMIPDVHITDANIRERVEDLDARLRTLEENIISLRDGNVYGFYRLIQAIEKSCNFFYVTKNGFINTKS